MKKLILIVLMLLIFSSVSAESCSNDIKEKYGIHDITINSSGKKNGGSYNISDFAGIVLGDIEKIKSSNTSIVTVKNGVISNCVKSDETPKTAKIVVTLKSGCTIDFNVTVVTGLTSTQERQIALFAANMINYAQNKHHNLIVYGYSYNRVEGYKGQLTNKKWIFDCSSFASYVYHKMTGKDFLIKGRPYLVEDFMNDKINFTEVKLNGAKKYSGVNVKLATVKEFDFSKLDLGDLIIFNKTVSGERPFYHIAIYVGNNNIAHVSSVNGIAIVNVNSYYGDNEFCVFRYNKNIDNINTVIKWPDTGKKEDLFQPFQYDSSIEYMAFNSPLKIDIKDSITSKRVNNLIWSSSNESIATVDSKGQINSKWKSGKVEIIGKSKLNDLEKVNLTIKVDDYPTTDIKVIDLVKNNSTKNSKNDSQNISKDKIKTISLKLNNQKYNLVVSDSKNNIIDSKILTYKVDNKNISVSKNGQVKLKKKGSSKITISSDNGKTISIKINVK